jgi:Holliday junction resolvasome RuvABC endonuclease subunit
MKKTIKYITSGTINTTAEYTVQKISDITEQIEKKTKKHAIDIVLIEGVEFRQGNLTSHTSHVRGNVHELAYLIGAIFNTLYSPCRYIEIVKPQDWKGNMPKNVLTYRVERALENMPGWKEKRTSQHERDAIGITLAYMDMLTIKKVKK